MPTFVIIEDGQARIVAGAFASHTTVNQAVQDPPEEEGGELPELRHEDVVVECAFPPGWLESASDEERGHHGVFVLEDPEIPEGQRVVGGLSAEHLIVVDGAPAWNITFEGPDLAELRAAKRAAADAAYLAQVAGGFPVPGFPGETLQLRDARDRTNWLALQARAQKRIAAGAGDDAAPLPPRSTANHYLPMTYVEVDEVLDALMDWAGGLYGVLWALKDAIAAAADAEALAAIDVEGAFPA